MVTKKTTSVKKTAKKPVRLPKLTPEQKYNVHSTGYYLDIMNNANDMMGSFEFSNYMSRYETSLAYVKNCMTDTQYKSVLRYYKHKYPKAYKYMKEF